MKTLHFILACFFPLLLSSQSALDERLYPIIGKGERWIAQGSPDSALIYAQNLLKKRTLDVFSKGQLYFVAGRSSFALGNADNAIPFLQKSVDVSKKQNLEPLLLHSLIALSAAYGDEARDLDSSLICLNATKPLAVKLRDTIALANYFIYASNILYLSQNYEEALKNNYLCESLLKNTKFEYEKGKNYAGAANNLMEIYIKTERKEILTNAQETYKKAIQIFQGSGRRYEEAYVRNSLAGSYLYSEDIHDSAKEVQLSIKIGEQLNDTSILLYGYYTLSTFYEMGAKADSARDALIKLKYYLEKTGTASEFEFMKTQFGNGDSKISTALISGKIGIFNKQIENQRILKEKQLLVFGISGLSILILCLLVLYRQKNKLLKEKLNNVLKAQEIEYMRARFEGEEIGRHRIARQIHDGVGGLLVSAKWNLESALEEISEKEVKVAARLNENLRLQENSYKELRRVVYELEREGTPWWEDLQKLYQQMAERNTTKIRFYTYNLDRKVGGVIGEEARLIVQEIITNALKHAKATEINVQINQIEDVLGIIIEDNGIGFDQNRIVKGIGLKSIEERCSKLGGEISLETGKGAGTTVFVDIPLSKQNILKENPLLYAGAN